jgi:thioredoxin reductase (NADPH)
MNTNPINDVVIVGGGAAGLSAAVTLARSLRSVVVIDAGEPRNAPAEGVHNLLAREGINPLDLVSAGRKEAERYGAVIRHTAATAVHRTDDGFTVDLADGASVTARRLLLATGLVDELPDLPGVREFWGTSALHCPYCHGWEVRGTRIGVLATSPNSVHQALLFRQLSEQVTFFRHRMPDPGAEMREQFAALGIRVVEGEVSHLRGEDGTLKAVVLEGGNEHPVDAVTVAPRFVARADLFEQLGGSLTENPMGEFIESDLTGQTAVPGVWAAGNSRDLGATVAASAAAGVAAGGAINANLIAEDAAAAVARSKAH